MINKENLLERVVKFLGTEWQPREERIVDNTKIDEYTVDTCYCNDTNKYETAIKKYDNEWVVLEEYDTKEQSQYGHNKWIEFAKTKPAKAYSIQFEEEVEL